MSADNQEAGSSRKRCPSRGTPLLLLPSVSPNRSRPLILKSLISLAPASIYNCVLKGGRKCAILVGPPFLYLPERRRGRRVVRVDNVSHWAHVLIGSLCIGFPQRDVPSPLKK